MVGLGEERDELLATFVGLDVQEEVVDSNTEYLREHVFYLERREPLRRTA